MRIVIRIEGSQRNIERDVPLEMHFEIVELLMNMGVSDEAPLDHVFTPKLVDAVIKDVVSKKLKYKKGAKKKAKSIVGGGKSNRTTVCKKCGTSGHMAKTCKSSTDVIGERAIDQDRSITKEDWAELKDAFDSGMAVGALSVLERYSKYEEQEMRSAVRFDTYEDYKDSKKF